MSRGTIALCRGRCSVADVGRMVKSCETIFECAEYPWMENLRNKCWKNDLIRWFGFLICFVYTKHKFYVHLETEMVRSFSEWVSGYEVLVVNYRLYLQMAHMRRVFHIQQKIV